MPRLWTLFCLCLVPLNSDGANILLYMSMGSKSHWHVWSPLANELADRGHHLTVVSPIQDKGLLGRDNVRSIVTHQMMESSIKSEEIFKGSAEVNFDKLKGDVVEVRTRS